MRTTRFFLYSAYSFAACIALIANPAWAADGFKTSPEVEKEQLAILRSDAPPAQKAIACKKLAIDGSGAAAADLGKLLSDPQLNSWARIALEAIPGPEADLALRQAAESLDGLLLVGVINSIGVRRDAAAVDLLTKRLEDRDADVASAAAVALGRIGDDGATKALRSSLASAPAKTKSAVAEGLILCAERLNADGKSAEAVEIYDEVRKAEVPKQRIVEATRGAILARKQDGIPLLVEQLRSQDKALSQIALSTAREIPGSGIDKALAEELAEAQPERAALIIHAMADRPKTVVLAAVAKAAGPGPKPVRLAAISALARVGDGSCLAALLDTATDDDADLATAAKAALADLPGEDVNPQIASLLAKAEGKRLPLLIELVGRRRIEATSALLKSLDSNDKSVRAAALAALGETVDLKGLPVLVTQVVTPKNAGDAAIATQALKAASVRMPDREAAAAQLAAAVDRTQSVPTKGSLLEILGAMGGPKALATVGAAGKSKNPELQDVSTKLLGEWMTEDAAPVLLDLSKAPDNKYQVRALRGYIRIARQFVLPEEQRVAMCREAMAAAKQPAEQKLVLEVLRRYPSIETLKLAVQAMSKPELNDDASAAVLFIAQKVGTQNAEVGPLLTKAGFDKVKLEIVKAEYGAGSTQRDVTEVLRKQVGDLPVLTLPAGTYNTSFGGDPVPGSPKQLKIQYRLNGKAGEATFAENEVIVLPAPK
jgi:HEAT repeat protein